MDRNLASDVSTVGAIDVVPSILEVICRTTGMGYAAVARVTEDRWIACAVRDEIGFGLEAGGELQIETTICNEIRAHGEPVLIDDVDHDPHYRDHHTPEIYGLKSYISVPIILSDDSFFGTLCAISPQPAQVSRPEIGAMFKLFAQMIGYHIEASQSLVESKSALLTEKEASALREQFIAVLGHDLRNPLAGIQGGMRLLERENLSDRGKNVLEMVNSTVSRMAGLIDNVMDFARGRLGGGILLNPSHQRIDTTVKQVADELRASYPDREIVVDLRLETEVRGDHSRLGQLFSNLLGNALMHGDPFAPVRAVLDRDGDHLTFETINVGEPIPAEAMENLFSPFERGGGRSSLQGLGLGLYISSQIAQAHQGNLTAKSEGRETTFTFRMPIG
ncbi:GAF domain-containing sensor histidine kinase [Tsuneonella sp. HG222]